MKKLTLALLCGALAVLSRTPAWTLEADEPEPGAQSSPPGASSPTEAQESEILEFIGKNNAEMHNALSHARKENPDMFHQKMRELSGMYRDPEIREVFAKNMKVEMKVHKLADQLRQAQGAEKESLKKDLESALLEQFDAKLLAQETQIKKMQAEIGRLKERIAKRRSLKDQIVKKRLSEMSGDVDSWEW